MCGPCLLPGEGPESTATNPPTFFTSYAAATMIHPHVECLESVLEAFRASFPSRPYSYRFYVLAWPVVAFPTVVDPKEQFRQDRVEGCILVVPSSRA